MAALRDDELAQLKSANAALTEALAARTGELARREREYSEALAQQAATAEVLQVINQSAGDLTPVFDAMLKRVMRLGEAAFGSFYTYDGKRFHSVVHRGVPAAYAAFRAKASPVPQPGSTFAQALETMRSLQVVDLMAGELYRIGNPNTRAMVELGGVRTILSVPLCKDDALLGLITVYRQEVRAFSERQIALVEGFAAQAVIAMENARLLGELRQRTTDLQESLEYQTATSDVLKVISCSTFDLQRVFDTVVATAARLCNADQAMIARREGELARLAANFGFPPEYEAYFKDLGAFPADPHSPTTGNRAWRERQPVHVHDVTAVPGYWDEAIRFGKQRTSLGVPLLREGETVGVIVLARRRVAPFTDRQIELVRTFADQAVIAIENARLLTETREALEQQTATAEVLQVINSSPGDLGPVFDAILEKAHSLCGATVGNLAIYKDGHFHAMATHGFPEQVASLMQRQPSPPNDYTRQLIDGAQFCQIEDIRAIEISPDHLILRALVAYSDVRSVLFVPLRKDGALLGFISANRPEVRPFSDKEIALLENFAAQAVIAMENARLLTETREALEQQTATAEVLQVINSSPGDLTPVFDAILERAHGLCDIALGELELNENGNFRAVAMRGVSGTFAELLRQPFMPPPHSPLTRLLAGEPIVQITDLFELARERPNDPRAQAGAEFGLRTVLFVPLRKDNALLGYITFYRIEVRPFTEKEIALLQNFAAQAVIAIENTRLLTETREALEQQTATAEVLQVINASPGDLTLLFDAILEKALRLCESAFGVFSTYDGELFHIVAARGVPDDPDSFLQRPHKPLPGLALSRIVQGEAVVQIADITDDEAYRQGIPDRRFIADVCGGRTQLLIALRRDKTLLGMFNIFRQEVRPFTEKQIALLENFAAQAVIAIENARLLTETREALEQQTATAEVLQVINASPGDLAPVFDSMLEKAIRLCGGVQGALWTLDGERVKLAASHGNTPEFLARLREHAAMAVPEAVQQAMRERLLHIPDFLEHQLYRAGDPTVRAAVELGDFRSWVGVALVKDDAPVGALVIGRREVRPFSEKQITLLQNFAAQAVIAIENARLITETREALEQQTATAEVLQVINSSPGDLSPVFAAMLEKAMRLCEAAFGLLHTYDGERFRALAVVGISGAAAEPLHEWVPDPGSALERLVRGDQVVHIPDVIDTEAYRSGVASRLKLVALTGARTALWVALRKDDALVGAFVIYRQEVRPFSNKQIALLENFAAQAVIAMENARLITETREALEQQTATAEVLQVINSSPGDLKPVFDAILDKAHSLCGATVGNLAIYKDGHFHAMATHGFPEQVASLMRHPFPPNFLTRELIDGARSLQIEDLRAIELDPDHLIMRALVEYSNVRGVLFVPLRKDGALLGFISANRPEVRPFSDKEIALLENFAAQAVIAMENARLITETREALEQQTATAEVLQVINTSPGDLGPVFEAILERAMRLCSAAFGSLYTYDGERFQSAAHRGVPPAYAAFREENPPLPTTGGGPATILATRKPLQVVDMKAHESYRRGVAGVRAMVDLGGVRTILTVPLIKDDIVLGIVTVYRQDVRAFSHRQITLLESFAAQAVIAMENARLINETREALEQQTATAEVLQVINSSPGDLAPVFDCMLEKALHLCGGAFGILNLFDGEIFHGAAMRGVPAAFAEFRAGNPAGLGSGTAPARILAGENVVHNLDLKDEAPYRDGDPYRRAIVDLGGARSHLAVALRKDDALLGMLTIYRQEVRSFSGKEISLLRNFAAQAVIAMENARLLTETREALEQQTATAEVLQVINASPGDLVPVFDAILEKAHSLCHIAQGSLELYDGERFRAVAVRGMPDAFADMLRQGTPGFDNPATRPLIEGRRFSHIRDLTETDYFLTQRAVEIASCHTLLCVPLRRDGILLGMIASARREVRPFSEKEIALLENFAAQAVIAMENARLLTELQQRTDELVRRNSEYGERIEHQSATIDVLEAMSASPGDPEPVFDLIVRRARDLCDGMSVGLFEYDGTLVHIRADCGGGPAARQFAAKFPIAPTRESLACRAIMDRQVVHIRDMDAEPGLFQSVRDMGAKTTLSLPLLRDGVAIGAISLNSAQPGGFSDTQVELLRIFAEQAVIAITSADTYRELQERTAALALRNSEYGERIEQQAATIDVLKVISASPDDTQPVFDQIVNRAQELCNGWAATLFEFDGELVHVRAYTKNFPEPTTAAFLALFPMAPTRGSITSRAILDRRIIHVRDMDAETALPIVRSLPHKSQLTIPLLRDEVAIGALTLAALEPGGFSDSQVALLQTFAEQAVIAITSVANFRALRERTAELTRSVAELRALEEVLRAVNSSLELETVLATIIGRAVRLSDADEGTIYEFDDEAQVFVPKSAYGMSEERVAALRDRRIRIGETPLGNSAAMRAPLHISDLTQTPDIDGSRVLVEDGIHALLAVPLLREEKVLGGLVIRRRAVGGFAPSVPTLLQTFAGQCVLAIENARLFQEARQARVEAEATLADLRRTQNRLVQSEKMASLGQLTAGIAHEIKNPLNFVNNFSELSVDLLDELHEAVAPERLAVADGLRREIDELTATLKGNLEKIAEHGRRADSIVKNMLLHSRSGPGEHRMADLNSLAEEALNLAYHGARAATPGFNITLETRLDPRAGMIDMYPQEITRVLLNLIGNGFYAAHKRAEVVGNLGFEPTLALTTRDLGDVVEIRVRDNGTGISEAVRDRIFEPFFTTKPAGEGTGLGLSLSYDIVVQQHGGRLTVDSEPDAFTEFVVTLPRTIAVAAGAPA